MYIQAFKHEYKYKRRLKLIKYSMQKNDLIWTVTKVYNFKKIDPSKRTAIIAQWLLNACGCLNNSIHKTMTKTQLMFIIANEW
jgi:hypothetical protein